MDKGMIATQWLIVGFALGLGTWQSITVGAILGIINLKWIKRGS